MSKTRLWWAAFVLCLALIIGHDQAAIFRAELWAEDGANLFTCAVTRGTPCLWQSVIGYHVFGSRLIAWLASAFPVVAAPYLYAASSAVINAAICAWLLSDGFAWLIPSRLVRFGVAVLIACGAGSGEVFLNIANLGQGLLLLAFLILLHQPFELSWKKLVLLTAIVFTTGESVLLAPLLGWLFLRTRRREYLAGLAVVVIGVVVNRVSSQLAINAHYTAMEHLRDTPRIYVEQLVTRVFVLPWIGPSLTDRLVHASDAIFWSLALLLVVAGAGVIRFSRIARPEAALLAITALSMAARFPMTTLFRNYAFPMLSRPTATVSWDTRYAFLIGSFATIAWVAILSRLRDRRVAGLLAAPLVFVVLFYYPVEHWRRDVIHWPGWAAKIQAAVDARNQGRLAAPVTIEGIPLQPWFDFSLTITPRP